METKHFLAGNIVTPLSSFVTASGYIRIKPEGGREIYIRDSTSSPIWDKGRNWDKVENYHKIYINSNLYLYSPGGTDLIIETLDAAGGGDGSTTVDLTPVVTELQGISSDISEMSAQLGQLINLLTKTTISKPLLIEPLLSNTQSLPLTVEMGLDPAKQYSYSGDGYPLPLTISRNGANLVVIADNTTAENIPATAVVIFATQLN